jgi:hypothetical protein
MHERIFFGIIFFFASFLRNNQVKKRNIQAMAMDTGTSMLTSFPAASAVSYVIDARHRELLLICTYIDNRTYVTSDTEDE